MLQGHPQIQCLIEPFHPHRYEGRFHRLATEDSIDAALQTIWTRWNGIKHVWESDGWPFPERPELNNQVARSARKVIVLLRRNYLRRIVSNLLSRRTQFWIGTRAEFLARLEAVDLPPLNVDLVFRQIRRDQRAIIDCQQHLVACDKPTIVLYYEDLFREQAETSEQHRLVNTILEFLEFAPVTAEAFERDWRTQFDPEVHRWATKDIYRRIPGIMHVEERIGCEETGYLFR